MENLLRRYGIYAKFALVALAALLLSVVFSNVIAGYLAEYTVPKLALESASEAEQNREAKEPKKRSRRIAYAQQIGPRCLFGCPEPAEKTEDKECPEECPEGTECVEGVCQKEVVAPPTDYDLPQPSDMNMTLVGTIVAQDEEYSTAMVRNDAGKYTLTVGVGDTFEDAEVVEITRDRLIIRRKGRLEYLQLPTSMLGQPTAPVSVRSPSPAPGRGSDAPGARGGKGGGEMPDGVERVGSNRYKLDKELVEKIAESPRAIVGSASLTPNKSGGVKLMGVGSKGFLGQMGLQTGDVVRSINGAEVSSSAQAIERIQSAARKNRMAVEIERRGKREKMIITTD